MRVNRIFQKRVPSREYDRARLTEQIDESQENSLFVADEFGDGL